MAPGKTWRRTAVERYGKLVPVSDDWTLFDDETGIGVGRISCDPHGGPRPWKAEYRVVDNNELRDAAMAWYETGPEAKAYVESNTYCRTYHIKRKRTKEEILAHAGVRPKPKRR
jgi:hypothetical protein